MRLAIIFLIISLVLCRPLLSDAWYPTHDTTHIARLSLMEQTIAQGLFPPIWAEGINGGLGYPLFHFYAPLFYYLALGVKLVVGSYFIAIKIVLIGSLWFGMLGMYSLIKSWFGRAAGLFAAVAFVTLPYVALNIYVRGAYAEFLAMMLLPWLFYGWQTLASKKQIILASTVTVCFICAHNLIPLITAPFLFAWIIYRHKKNLRILIIPTLFTCLLASFYLAPLLFERHFVQAETVAKTTNYGLHFVAPSQLWNSTWGFGGSAQGLEDGMSFKIGKFHLLLAASAIGLLLVKAQKGKVIFFAISLLLAAYMTTPYSQLIWERIHLLQVVQFPWRYLALVGFFAAVLASTSISLIKNKLVKSTLISVVMGALLFFNLKLFIPQTTFPTRLEDYTSEQYLETIPAIVPEYLPRWMSRGEVLSTTPQDRAYYPTWKVKIDGKFVPTWPGENGLLTYENPSGSNTIELIQSHTAVEKISYLLTLIGIITILIYAKI